MTRSGRTHGTHGCSACRLLSRPGGRDLRRRPGLSTGGSWIAGNCSASSGETAHTLALLPHPAGAPGIDAHCRSTTSQGYSISREDCCSHECGTGRIELPRDAWGPIACHLFQSPRPLPCCESTASSGVSGALTSSDVLYGQPRAILDPRRPSAFPNDDGRTSVVTRWMCEHVREGAALRCACQGSSVLPPARR